MIVDRSSRSTSSLRIAGDDASLPQEVDRAVARLFAGNYFAERWNEYICIVLLSGLKVQATREICNAYPFCA